MSTTLARLAAAVLPTEKGRKTVGWVIAAIRLRPSLHGQDPNRIQRQHHRDADSLLSSGFGGRRRECQSRERRP